MSEFVLIMSSNYGFQSISGISMVSRNENPQTRQNSGLEGEGCPSVKEHVNYHVAAALWSQKMAAPRGGARRRPVLTVVHIENAIKVLRFSEQLF